MKKLAKAIIKRIEKKVQESNDWYTIPNANEKFFYIAPHRYKGEKLELPDGTVIESGDLVAEIHINNLKADKLEDVSMKNIFRIINNEFNCLAEAIVEDERFIPIKAYHGKTLFHSALKRQGFTIKDVEITLSTYFISVWENILRKVFANTSSTSKKSFRKVKEFWATKNDIMTRKQRKAQK